MKLLFATNNKHKAEEVRSMVDDVEILTLKEAGINIDIPEPHDTLEENSLEKAQTIYNLTKQNCFAEDTGLEVIALNKEPGVRSARYAGEPISFEKNTLKLLENLEDKETRKAEFRTIATLIIDGKVYQFEGCCSGSISSEQRGTKGFGYDPVFIPEGSSKTFAEMGPEEKNVYSHRKLAIEKMINFIKVNRHLFNN